METFPSSATFLMLINDVGNSQNVLAVLARAGNVGKGSWVTFFHLLVAPFATATRLLDG
jgi:hypothetical protein